MLELVKYHWEPEGFIKMIVCNSVLLLLLKQFRRETMFLGSPLVMTFMYMYSREYEAQASGDAPAGEAAPSPQTYWVGQHHRLTVHGRVGLVPGPVRHEHLRR